MGVLVVLGQRRFLMSRSRRTPNQYSQERVPFINHALIPPTGRPHLPPHEVGDTDRRKPAQQFCQLPDLKGRERVTRRHKTRRWPPPSPKTGMPQKLTCHLADDCRGHSDTGKRVK